tara:strand:- start:1309 stop:3042 length:1734 start_codon:yes stop_codon:yes gene_type:complete
MNNNLYKKLLLMSIFSVSSISQELDPAFLASLPEEVAKDLVDGISVKKSQEETQYRRPSSFIEKPDPTSDRYGAQVFSMMQSTLMPINEPNFDGSYILDFGDQLELQLIGQQSSTSQYSIRRDGSINITDIGKVFVSGLSLNQAVELIKSKVNQSFIGVSAYLTLVNIRDIQVTLAGNVYNPGIYTLNGNSNIFHALSVSGGPSEDGSFRSIDLIRDNKKIESVDLYKTFIYGKSMSNSRLRSGDIVFVNPVKNIVTTSGALKRPGEYELLEDEDLSLSIKFANGINKYADMSSIKLERILDGSVKIIPISNISQFKNIKSNDGDRVFIRGHSFRVVEALGALENPGVYLMNEGDTISDVIMKAGGYTNDAYPFGGVYENEYAKEINSLAKESLYKSFLENLASISNQSGEESENLSPLIEIIKELNEAEPSGRIIVDFETPAQQAQIKVKDGDKIYIPERTNQVYVFGSLSSEGSAAYISGKTVQYYIEKKGGFNKLSDTDSIYILQPNGETLKYSERKNLFMSQPSEQFVIYPGSIIFVPRKIDNEYGQRLRTQAYASILSSLGVSLASLSVLNN